MTQDEWLFNLAKIEIKKIADKDLKDREYVTAQNINQLEDYERKRVIEKMKNYWKEHKSSSLEFLVNDAIVNCDKGSIMSRVKGKDHGVYTDKQGGQALLNEDDRKLKTTDHIVFGCCSLEDKEDNKWKAKKFTKWYGVNSKVYIGEGKSSLIMSSYMICPYHKNAYIKPVTSGQEFTFTDSLFEYPKFVVERGEKHAYFKMEYWNKYDFKRAEINMKVIRKLAIRNISILAKDIEGTNTKGYYERKWIEYLAKFMLLCEDKGILCNIINEFYGKADFSESEVSGKSILLENYNLLLQKSKNMYESILMERRYEKESTIMNVIRNHFLLIIVKCLNAYVVNGQKNTIKSIEDINSLSCGIEDFYGNGINIEHWTIDASTYIKTTHTYISEVKINDTTLSVVGLWEYFAKERDSLFVELLIINLVATAAIIALPTVGTIVGSATLQAANTANIASVVWTVGSSFLGERLEGDEARKFEKNRYKQSRISLLELFRQIKVYMIYSNKDENSNTFLYKVYPSKSTEILINNFLNNISRIYIKKTNKSVKEKCLINILGLNDILYKPLTTMTKIDCLIAALTLETITNFDIFESEDIVEQKSKDAINTGMKVLELLTNLTIEGKKYIVEIEIGNKRISIDDTSYIKIDGKDISKLFTDILM